MDPIADMLIRIKNAALAKKGTAFVPHSKMKMGIAKILKEKGFIAAVERRGRKNRKFLELILVSGPEGRGIEEVRRVSKPSRRIYKKRGEIRRVRGGTGVAIISTSQGLKTDEEARKERLGGEVICEVW